MKKFFMLAALAAAVSSTHAQNTQYTPGLTPMESAKFWTLSGSLRGFYDDNYATAPSGPGKQNSFGFEVSPSVAVHFNPNESTLMSASYVYDMRWYDDRKHSADHSHQFNAKLDHAFTEKYKLQLNDSFVVAQEPTILDPSGSTTSTPLRANGNNIRNTGSANFMADLTQNVGMEFGYVNNVYDYEQDATDTGGLVSRSALLDRMEHLASINLRWRVSPETVAILGYQFGLVNYTSSEFIDGASVKADVRDARVHYLLAGADHSFSPQLNGSVRVGAQYYDYYNIQDANSSLDSSQVNPYADANLTYTYARGSYLQGGVKHMHNATDVTGSSTDPVRDQESTSVYLSVTHKITSSLTGSFLGQFQHSVFNGGGTVGTTKIDGRADNFFIAGVNLAYRITPNFLAEAGYNYDRLYSEIGGRSYTRNRVYIGVRVTY